MNILGMLLGCLFLSYNTFFIRLTNMITVIRINTIFLKTFYLSRLFLSMFELFFPIKIVRISF